MAKELETHSQKVCLLYGVKVEEVRENLCCNIFSFNCAQLILFMSAAQCFPPFPLFRFAATQVSVLLPLLMDSQLGIDLALAVALAMAVDLDLSWCSISWKRAHTKALIIKVNRTEAGAWAKGRVGRTALAGCTTDLLSSTGWKCAVHSRKHSQKKKDVRIYIYKTRM